jgi:nucleoside-diphosphate-sugar epimerase
LCQTQPHEPVLNIGSGVRTQVSDVLELITALLPEVTIETIDGTPGDQFGIYSDNSRMRAALGMEQLTPLAVGLRTFWQSVRNTQ